MVDAAREKGGVGRDIGKMFRQQDDTLKQWRVEEKLEAHDEMHEEKHTYTHEQFKDTRNVRTDIHVRIEQHELPAYSLANTGRNGSEDIPTPSQQTDDHIDHVWHSGDSSDEAMGDADSYRCEKCGATMPLFAMFAHERYHKSIQHF